MEEIKKNGKHKNSSREDLFQASEKAAKSLFSTRLENLVREA